MNPHIKQLVVEGRQLLEKRTKVTRVVTHKYPDGRTEHNSSVSHHDDQNHYHYHVGTLSLPDGSGESYALNTHQNGQPVNDGAGTEVYRKGYKKGTFDPEKAHQETLRALQAGFEAT